MTLNGYDGNRLTITYQYMYPDIKMAEGIGQVTIRQQHTKTSKPLPIITTCMNGNVGYKTKRQQPTKMFNKYDYECTRVV